MIQLRNIEKRYETKAGFTYDLFKQLNQQGTTIVQVTHNEAWAAYGRKFIRLKDGWMEK
jgi:putative ABC transport system ATP-binding protein